MAGRAGGVGVLEPLFNSFTKIGKIRALNGLRFQGLLQALDFSFGLGSSILRIRFDIREKRRPANDKAVKRTSK